MMEVSSIEHGKQEKRGRKIRYVFHVQETELLECLGCTQECAFRRQPELVELSPHPRSSVRGRSQVVLPIIDTHFLAYVVGLLALSTGGQGHSRRFRQN